MNVNILIIIAISVAFILTEKILINKIRKLKNENAYIRWQLDFYKEQYDKLGKILINLDKE